MTNARDIAEQRQMNTDIAGIPSPAELPTEEYNALFQVAYAQLKPNHDLVYVPLQGSQIDTTPTALGDAQKVRFVINEHDAITEIMRNTDAVICISRDENPNPGYSDAQPERNKVLTPSGGSNVKVAADLFTIAHGSGNENIKFISTGRMHNRAIRMMLALPVIAEFIGINAEDAYHTPEAQFEKLLNIAFTHENADLISADILSLPENTESDYCSDDHVKASVKAVRQLLEEAGLNIKAILDRGFNPGEIETAKNALIQEYRDYPRISTSRLMVERAIALGVTPEAILEEDGAVDTITNLLNVTATLENIEAEHAKAGEKKIKNIVIVASRDHMPRILWIADHILPENYVITFIESDPMLDQDAYRKSCIRELGSLKKGYKWIGHIAGKGALGELEEVTDSGYFGVNRLSANEISSNILR